MNASFDKLTAEDALRQLELMEQVSFIDPTDMVKFYASAPQSGTLADMLAVDLQALVLSVLKLDAADFSPTTPLMDYGLDSIAATEIGNLFTQRFNIVIPPTVFFEFPDLTSFVTYLTDNYREELLKIYPETGSAKESKKITTKTAELPDSIGSKVVVPIHKTLEKAPSTLSQTSPAVMPEQGSLSIENLWQLMETGAPHTTKNDTVSLSLAQPLATVTSLRNAVSNEIRQPSREFLREMEIFTDQAMLHHITRVGKRDLEYATYGEGPPLLMLGGLLMHYNVMWRTNLKVLGEHHTLIMFHMPGCGGLKLYEGLSLQTLAQDIAEVLDAQGITQPIPVFGCSFGGVMAQAFAIAYPQKCSALAIAVSTPFAEGATDFQKLMKELQVSSHFMELNRGWPMANLSAYEKVIEGFDFRAALRKLNIPTLVIAGGRDRYTTPEFSHMMADNLHGSKLEEFVDAGHLLTFSHYEAFNALLIDFLMVIPNQHTSGTKHRAPTTEPSAFLPATTATLDTMRSYIERGSQGHCVILSEPAAQLALTLNAVCNHSKTQTTHYHNYAVTSLEEAVDAAIRLARHYERNRRQESTGSILIIDRHSRWVDYFNPLNLAQQDALVQEIHRVDNWAEAEALSAQLQFAAVVIVGNTELDPEEVSQWIVTLRQRKTLSVLVEIDQHDCPPQQWLSYLCQEYSDLMVFGEAISGFQAPIGVMLVNETVANPWMMTPNEGYVRQPMANFGLPAKLAFEYLADVFDDTLTAEQQSLLRRIVTDPQIASEIHTQYGNVGYAKVAQMHGFDSRFFEAYGARSRVVRQGEPSREIIDCLANVGSAPRGLNPQDVISDVLAIHEPQHDYWDDLATFLQQYTGLPHLLPASSQTTALETALTLAHLASPARKKVLYFAGGAGFSMLSANSALDTQFDLFRKPFQPLYPHAIFIDPTAENAATELETALLSGELAFVWLETIQVEGNAVRPLPQHLIKLVDQYRQQGEYWVGVDETQTSIATGQFLHSTGLMEQPDLVAMAMSLTDSLFPIGAVLASDRIIQAAMKTNPRRLATMHARSRNPLSAHIALHSLQRIESDNLMQHAVEMGAYLKQSLQELAESFPLLKEVRGEGLVLAIELDLAGYDAFIQQSFGYFLWGAMLRDPEGGVALVVCPIHNHSLRVMPPLTITREEIDLLIANVRRRLSEGVNKIIADCAEYATQRGDVRLAGFLNNLRK